MSGCFIGRMNTVGKQMKYIVSELLRMHSNRIYCKFLRDAVGIGSNAGSILCDLKWMNVGQPKR